MREPLRVEVLERPIENGKKTQKQLLWAILIGVCKVKVNNENDDADVNVLHYGQFSKLAHGFIIYCMVPLDYHTQWKYDADYDVNEKLGIAVRYSEWETGANTETDKLTIAPNYAITSSLGAILEYSSQDDNAGNDTDLLALELTYTF